jgi:hypothetical protein
MSFYSEAVEKLESMVQEWMKANGRTTPPTRQEVVRNMEGIIEQWMEKNAIKPVSRRHVAQRIDPISIIGGCDAFNDAWDNLVAAGKIKNCGKSRGVEMWSRGDR